MPRKRLLTSGALLLLLISAATISGLLSAQNSGFISNFRELIKVKSGDDTVVATVNGIEFTQREVRLGADIITSVDPTISQDDAIRQSILHKVDRHLTLSEVKRRSLMPTIAEARELMQAQKELCMGPLGAECREFIKRVGFSTEDIWEQSIPGYQEDLGRMRLMEILHTEWQKKVDQGLIPAEEDHIVTLKILGNLRNNAQIVWKDDRLESLFEEAQTTRTNNLYPPTEPVPPGPPHDTTNPAGNPNE